MSNFYINFSTKKEIFTLPKHTKKTEAFVFRINLNIFKGVSKTVSRQFYHRYTAIPNLRPKMKKVEIGQNLFSGREKRVRKRSAN